MGLTKYRGFKDAFQDNGEEVHAYVGTIFSPDFKNRNTIQLWDVSANGSPFIKKWTGVTLENTSLHEITVVNSSNTTKLLTFASSYELMDELPITDNDLYIGPNGAAHFYCTAYLQDNNLVLALRTGSQDKRNL